MDQKLDLITNIDQKLGLSIKINILNDKVGNIPIIAPGYNLHLLTIEELTYYYEQEAQKQYDKFKLEKLKQYLCGIFIILELL